jgi:hypothetical protein
MKIPHVLSWLGEEEIAALGAVIESNWITEGTRSSEFITKFNQLLPTFRRFLNRENNIFDRPNRGSAKCAVVNRST